MNDKVISNDNFPSSFEGNKLNNLYETSNGGFTSTWKKHFEKISQLKHEYSNSTWSEIIYKCRNSRKLVLLVVFIALFFDNMLLTTVGKQIRFVI